MPMRPSPRRRRQPPDQADGLRALFACDERPLLALVHNPFVAFGGVAMERIAVALGECGLNTLVVDAADTATTPHELAEVDLGACIEPLSARVSYLAARGLPLRWIDSRAGTSGFVDALWRAAPRADVVLLHAGASDLRRALTGTAACPLVQLGTHPDSLTHAYAAVKLLAQRAGIAAFDQVVITPPNRPGAAAGAERLAHRLADCSERFLGVAVRSRAEVDPAADPDGPTTPELAALLRLQLQVGIEPAFAAAALRAHARPN
jgi:hypothetical protein